jgi:hypothetical protein
MKKKLCTALGLIAFYSTVSYSQNIVFDISKYKLPDIKLSTLDFSMDMDHSIYKFEHLAPFSNRDYQRNFNGLFTSVFDHYRNTEKYQGDQSATLSISPQYSKENYDGQLTKNNRFYLRAHLYSTNRFYNSSGRFLEIDPAFEFNYTDSYYLHTTTMNKEKPVEGYLSVPVSIGFGRIEPVADARLAVYIIDELTKNGKIINQPSESKILELASVISAIKRKRFFDSRERNIEELQTVDSFLVSNNIVAGGDIIYFTRLNDQWSYASGPSRNSGFRVNFGISDEIRLSKDYIESSYGGLPVAINTQRTNEFAIGAFGNMQYSKPLNLYWQSDLTFNMAYSYEMTRYPEEGNGIDNNLNSLSPILRYNLRYLPDSRTSVSLTLGTGYSYIFGPVKRWDTVNSVYVKGRTSGNALNPSARINMYYYLSPQLRLNMNWYFSYNMSNSGNRFDGSGFSSTSAINSLNNTFSLTLTYSLF